jgi:hypothetical protein
MLGRSESLTRTINPLERTPFDGLNDIANEFAANEALGGLVIWIDNSGDAAFWIELAQTLQNQFSNIKLDQLMIKVDSEIRQDMSQLFQSNFFQTLQNIAISSNLTVESYSLFLDSLKSNSHLVACSLDSMCFNLDNISGLLQSIDCANNVKTLSLTSAGLPAECATQIISNLPFCVKALDLTENPITLTQDNVEAFVKALNDTHLHSLSLSSMTDKCVNALKYVLLKNPNLQLNLTVNAELNKKGIAALYKFVTQSHAARVSIYDPIEYLSECSKVQALNAICEERAFPTLQALAARAVAKQLDEKSDEKLTLDILHIIGYLPAQSLAQHRQLITLRDDESKNIISKRY